MAYARLGAALASLDIPADRYLAKAYSLRNRVSEREGFYISSHYFHVAVGDLQSASQVYGLWARTYPQDKGPPGDLGVLYMSPGQYDKAVGALRHALDLPLRTRWTTRTSPDAISTSIAPIRQRRHLKRLGLGESTPQDFAPGPLQ
jgi:hypothetical protein